MKNYVLALATLLSLGCTSVQNEKQITGKEGFNIYSGYVKDSFKIFIGLPRDYNKASKYPVVYLLDANYYFDPVKASSGFHQDVNMVQPFILVGIGYPDAATIEDNRNRDDTYPVADRAYEMAKSGGADDFLSFLSFELFPAIDKQFATDTSQRMLAGHSLAGYFAMHAFSRSVEGRYTGISSYIAASPSLHYNDQYLLKKLRTIKAAPAAASMKVYLTYGGLEDAEEADVSGFPSIKAMMALLDTSFELLTKQGFLYKADSFSNLGHMDTQFPSFSKGTQWVFPTE